MAETYSLAISAAHPHNVAQPKVVVLPDAHAQQGHQQGAMTAGTPVLCKGLDGSLAYHVFDAERWTPGLAIMRRL